MSYSIELPVVDVRRTAQVGTAKTEREAKRILKQYTSDITKQGMLKLVFPQSDGTFIVKYPDIVNKGKSIIHRQFSSWHDATMYCFKRFTTQDDFGWDTNNASLKGNLEILHYHFDFEDVSFEEMDTKRKCRPDEITAMYSQSLIVHTSPEHIALDIWSDSKSELEAIAQRLSGMGCTVKGISEAVKRFQALPFDEYALTITTDSSRIFSDVNRILQIHYRDEYQACFYSLSGEAEIITGTQAEISERTSRIYSPYVYRNGWLKTIFQSAANGYKISLPETNELDSPYGLSSEFSSLEEAVEFFEGNINTQKCGYSAEDGAVKIVRSLNPPSYKLRFVGKYDDQEIYKAIDHGGYILKVGDTFYDTDGVSGEKLCPTHCQDWIITDEFFGSR